MSFYYRRWSLGHFFSSFLWAMSRSKGSSDLHFLSCFGAHRLLTDRDLHFCTLGYYSRTVHEAISCLLCSSPTPAALHVGRYGPIDIFTTCNLHDSHPELNLLCVLLLFVFLWLYYFLSPYSARNYIFNNTVEYVFSLQKNSSVCLVRLQKWQ